MTLTTTIFAKHRPILYCMMFLITRGTIRIGVDLGPTRGVPPLEDLKNKHNIGLRSGISSRISSGLTWFCRLLQSRIRRRWNMLILCGETGSCKSSYDSIFMLLPLTHTHQPTVPIAIQSLLVTLQVSVYSKKTIHMLVWPAGKHGQVLVFKHRIIAGFPYRP